MAFLSTKIIKGKKQWYLERSVRLPIGNVKKFSIYIKDYRPLNKEQLQRYTLLLNEKVSCALINAVGDYYQDHSIFTKEEI